MASDQNRYGLKRSELTASQSRTVRQACHFGCVICGKIPYHYEHFDPPFADAQFHDPEGIALLCPTCHQDKTSGRISTDRIRVARRNPYNATSPEAPWLTHFGRALPVIRCGGFTAGGSTDVIALQINDTVVLRATLPRQGADLLLEGALCDAYGKQTLRFHDNVIWAQTGAWDVTLTGKDLVVSAGRRDVVAHLRALPELGELHLLVLKMRLANGYRIDVEEGALDLGGPDGRRVHMSNCGICTTNGRPAFHLRDLSLGNWYDWLAHSS